MLVSITIIRYRKVFIPFAFMGMAIHRVPLWFNRTISFFKLMGSGRNGTFDKIPDLQQWAILAVHNNTLTETSEDDLIRRLYGTFLKSWFSFFNCETFTILLKPLEGHGYWDGKKVFGELDGKFAHDGPVATLTRARIRPGKLHYFWANVAPVAAEIKKAPGFITSFGIGEMPWIKQATFSVWQSVADMKAFAYGMKLHAEVIKKTRQQRWYSEEMFVRFKILGSSGTLRGKNPLNQLGDTFKNIKLYHEKYQAD